MLLRVLTPPYLLFFALLNIALGDGLALKAVTLAGMAGVVVAVGLLIRGGLRRMWIHRLDRDATPVQALTTGVETLTWFPGPRRPYRLTLQGLAAPNAGRVFRSAWISPPSGNAPAPEKLVVLIDPKRPSRYFVDVRGLQIDPEPRLWRWSRAIVLFGVVFLVFYVEDIVVSVAAFKPDTPGPPGPVRGEAHASGPDFGKGVNWSVQACRAAGRPGAAVSVFGDDDQPYPEASIVSGPSGGVAAFEVRRGAGADPVRFYPAGCTRLHGEVRPVVDANGRSTLDGYADAECAQGPDRLSLHVDFKGCL